MIENRVFHSYNEFRDHFLPNDKKKYPVRMDLTEEEAELIRSRRGGWKYKRGDRK